MGISQPVTIVGISQSNSFVEDTTDYILDTDGSQLLDTEYENILEFSGEI